MAFRGFGDDALKVKADKREAALKAAQIAASERASMRSANVQMAGLQENARQADMANERARAQLAAENERFDKQLAAREAARLDDLNLKREGMAADESYRREAMAAAEEARKDELSLKIAELSQRERQIQLNESTAARLDAEWQKQQAAQEELQRVDTAIQLAVIRAASLSSGPLGMPYINALNDLRGVAYGDPGSTTQVFPVIDPQTGARLGIGTVKIGEDGKEIQSILDPAIILPQVRKSMSPEKWEEFAQQLIGANKAKGSDRVTAAAIREMQKAKLEFAKSDPGSLLKTLAEQEDNLRFTKAPKSGSGKAADPANQENLERIGRIKTKVLKELEAQLDGREEATPAVNLTPEQRAFVTKPGTNAGAPTGRQPTGGTAQIPGVPQERLAELRAIAERAMATANGDKAKAEKIFNAEVAKRYPDLVPATQPSPGKVPKVSKEMPPSTPDDEKAPVSPLSRDASPETAAKKTVDAEEGERKPLPTAQSTGPRLETAPEGSAKIGPEKGTLEYLQGMPKGKAADLKGKEIGAARREILKRLEAAYRLPKSDEKVALVKRLRAELDEFNQKYRP